MRKEIDTFHIENRLGNVFNPVLPSTEFINDLQDKLKRKANVIVEYPNYVLPLIIISGGLFIGILLVWGLARLFSTIFGKKAG